MEEKLLLLPLHRNPQYTEDCKNILNEQWPRSQTIRYRSLHSSCDELPTSLVLVKSDNTNTSVIGHSRINSIPNDSNGIWVESVVVDSKLRGKGYGRILMDKTEEYAACIGFTCSFLSTIDQQGFYLKLGYEFCTPVCLYGGVINKNLIPKNFLFPVLNNKEDSTEKNKPLSKTVTASSSNPNANVTLQPFTPPPQSEAPPPNLPPPPPPPPALKNAKTKKTEIERVDFTNQRKMYMKKMISVL